MRDSHRCLQFVALEVVIAEMRLVCHGMVRDDQGGTFYFTVAAPADERRGLYEKP